MNNFELIGCILFRFLSCVYFFFCVYSMHVWFMHLLNKSLRGSVYSWCACSAHWFERLLLKYIRQENRKACRVIRDSGNTT